MIKFKHLIILLFLCGLAFATVYYLKDSKQNILVVDVNLLMEELVKDLTKNSESEDDIKSNTKQKLIDLNEILQDISTQDNAVIINKKAVVGGGEDITDSVRTLLEEYQND
jgi:hypothetical protein